uniref:HYR domain-containing protein n=1 Tax=Branchiostoma floridae TaxID=7739 RepID=C3XTS6_BRAFL|eukprot:XP_002612291.1 hypothetical protein BRAFLDRAFT_122528 [Branchiostoma floridae]
MDTTCLPTSSKTVVTGKLLLLADGQNVNRKTTGGRSALLIAHARGHSQCVDVLLDHGADTSDLPNGQVQRTANIAPGEDQQQDTEESPTFNRLSTHSSIGARDETETSKRKSPITTLDEQNESSSNGQKSGDLIAPPNEGTSQSRANLKHHSSPKEEDINPLKKVRSRSEDDEALDREDNGQPDRVDRLKQFSRTRSAGRRSSAPVVSLVNRPNSALVGRVKTWGGTPQPRVANLRRGSESSEADDRLSPLPGLTPRRHHHPATITADAASILKSMSSSEEVEPIAPPNSPRHAFIGLDPACPPARPRPSLTGRRLTGLRRVSLPAALPSRAKLQTGPSPNQKKTFDEWLEEVEERKKFEEEQKTWNRLQEMHEQALREDAKYKKRLSFDDWNRQKELEKIHKMEEHEDDKDKNQQKERRQKMSAEEYQKWVLRKEQEELEKERQKQKEAEKDYQRWLKLKEELQEVEKKMGRVSLRPKSTQRRMSLQQSVGQYLFRLPDLELPGCAPTHGLASRDGKPVSFGVFFFFIVVVAVENGRALAGEVDGDVGGKSAPRQARNAVPPSGLPPTRFTPDEIHQVVAVHNNLRSSVTPGAANMQYMNIVGTCGKVDLFLHSSMGMIKMMMMVDYQCTRRISSVQSSESDKMNADDRERRREERRRRRQMEAEASAAPTVDPDEERRLARERRRKEREAANAAAEEESRKMQEELEARRMRRRKMRDGMDENQDDSDRVLSQKKLEEEAKKKEEEEEARRREEEEERRKEEEETKRKEEEKKQREEEERRRREEEEEEEERRREEEEEKRRQEEEEEELRREEEEEKERREMEARRKKAEMRKREEEARKAEQPKTLMLKKAKEDLAQEAAERESAKRKYLEDVLPPLKLGGLSKDALESLCRDLHAQIEQAEEERFEAEYKVKKNDQEPELKKVKVTPENMLNSLAESRRTKPGIIDFRANLKHVEREGHDSRRGSSSTTKRWLPTYFNMWGTTVCIAVAALLLLCGPSTSVADSPIPRILCPKDVFVTLGRGYDTADVNLPTPWSNYRNITVSDGYQIGDNAFPAGKTEVTFSVVSPEGERDSCATKIYVDDQERPRVYGCPSSFSTEIATTYARVEWEEPIFTDNVGVVNVWQSEETNQTFTWGTFRVTYIATDAVGNSAECTFTVEVKRKSCGLPTPPDNGYSNCDLWARGKFCSPECEEGTVPADGEEMRTYACEADGEWRPSRKIVDCVVNCGRGTYHDSAVDACQPCPVGTYQDQERKTACIPCPDGLTTDAVGTKSIQICKGESLPSPTELLNMPQADIEGVYPISTTCRLQLNNDDCKTEISSDPADCLTVRELVETALPDWKLGDAFSIGGSLNPFNWIISNSYFDRCEEELSISTGSTEAVTIVPSVLTLERFSINVRYFIPTKSFEVKFTGLWKIGSILFRLTVEKSEGGFVVIGEPVDTVIPVGRLISGLASSLLPGNDARETFKSVNLDKFVMENIKLTAVFGNSGYGLQVAFDTGIGKSRVFASLDSIKFGDNQTKVFSVALSIKSISFGDLIKRFTNEGVEVPVLSDLELPEAAFLLSTKTAPFLISSYPDSLLQMMPGVSAGLNVVFQLKLSDGDPLGSFYLAVWKRRFQFQLLPGSVVRVGSLLNKMLQSVSVIELPSKLALDDVLSSTLQGFQYDGNTRTFTIPVAIETSLTIIPSVLVLDNLHATFHIVRGQSTAGGLNPQPGAVVSRPGTAVTQAEGTGLSFELTSVWYIGNVKTALSIAKPPGANVFIAEGAPELDIEIGKLIEDFGVALLPPGPMEDGLKSIGLDAFKVVNPSVSLVMGKDFVLKLAGDAVVNDWRCTVEVIVGSLGGTVSMATGLVLERIGIVELVKTLTNDNVDLSIIPGASILSNAQAAFVVSSSDMSKLNEYLRFSAPLLSSIDIVDGIGVVASFKFPPNCGQDEFCKVAKRLLGKHVELMIYGALSIDRVYMKAVIPTPIRIFHGADIRDVGFEIQLARPPEETYIGITGSLQLDQPPLLFTGRFGLSNKGVYLGMSSVGWWYNAFGLSFLSIGYLNFEITISPDPILIAGIDFGGQAVIGFNRSDAEPIRASLYVGINRIAPLQSYCKGSITKLTIPSILAAFAYRPNLPGFLDEIGFTEGVEFSFSAITRTLPNGILIRQGFFFKGKLEILFFKVTADIAIDKTSIFANMTVAPFNIANGLIAIEGRSPTQGPRLLVDIGWLPPRAKLMIEGSVTVLFIKRTINITMDEQGTRFFIEGSFLNLFRASLEVAASYGSIKTASFQVTGQMQQDLFRKLREKVENAIDGYVKRADEAIDAAKAKVRQAEVNWDIAVKDIQKAQRKVRAAEVHWDRAVAWFDEKIKDVRGAERHWDDAVAKLRHERSKCRFKKCKWYEAWCHAENAGRAICQGALWLAEQVVDKSRYLLDVAIFAMKAAREIVDKSRILLDAAILILKGAEEFVDKSRVILDVAEGFLEGVKQANRFGAAVAKKVAGAVLGGIIDIQEIGFSVKLAVAQSGHFRGWIKVAFFGGSPKEFRFDINLPSIEDMVSALVDMVRNALGLRRKREADRLEFERLLRLKSTKLCESIGPMPCAPNHVKLAQMVDYRAALLGARVIHGNMVPIVK